MKREDPDQLSIFERAQEMHKRKAQSKNISRVRGKIHRAILMFFSQCIVGTQFTGPELHRVIKRQVHDLAPDSPGRIMRLLRAEGLINYKVVSRKDSLYEVLEVEES